MLRIAVLILISALLVLPGFSQAGKRAEIKRIDPYAKTLDFFAKRNKRSNLVFADVSDYDQGKAKWRRFVSATALEKYREDDEVYGIANVWRRKSKVVLAVFTLSSPSGDWAKYVFMYFRPDGTIAKSESELRTFYGDFIVRQDFYFDVQGKLIKKTKNYFDLSTRKPKKPDDDYLGVQKGFVDEENYYLTTKKLPFAHLLKLR